MRMIRSFCTLTILTIFISSLFSPLTISAEEHTTPIVKLRILETTDLHAHILPYDYDKKVPSVEFGLARTATLIKQARAEVPKNNSMLFDVGDTIQGTPQAYYVAKVKKLKANEVHPVFKAMNKLKYDAATLGNHEFNYGMDFLKTSIKKANFPYVNANIYINNHDENNLHAFTPYVILDKQVKDENGNIHTLKVGVIGFAPPKVMDIDYLGKAARAKDIVQTAHTFIPEMKAKGVDLIIALAHSGLAIEVDGLIHPENAVYPLSKVAGIDAILFGHRHQIFPGAQKFNNIPGVDNVKGTINGVPSVEAGYWGNDLGIIDLTLEKTNNQWHVKDSQSSNRPVYKIENGQKIPIVEADPDVSQ